MDDPEGLFLMGVVRRRLRGNDEDQLAALAGLVLCGNGNRRREYRGE
jgi:hypothetical protein